MSNVNRVLIAAGGTGGHFYPAIALAKKLRERNVDVLFVIKENALTVESLKKENLRYRSISVAPWLGQSLFKLPFLLLSTLGAARECSRILRDFRPQRTVGFGAYISFPAVLASYFAGIPVLIHEQNPAPGWANRASGFLAKKVAVSFEETLRHFGDKAVLTGNLVREELFRGDRAAALAKFGLKPDRKTLFVFGGSAGAKSINRAVTAALPKLEALRNRIQFLHLTGSSEETKAVTEKYRELNFHAAVRDYSHEMDSGYACADLVVSRAGATTLTELAALRIPAIVVPYPFAGAHQEKNARVLTEVGAAILVRESENFEAELAARLQEILNAPEKLARMASAYQKFSIDLRRSTDAMADLVLI